MALLLTAGSFGLCTPAALAQAAPNVPVRSPDGSVRIDNNARNIRTGPLQNESNIPLPANLPESTSEGVAIPVDRSRLAPNSIEIRPDVPYIEQSFGDILNSQTPGDDARYEVQRNSFRITTTFGLVYRPGAHLFGEGIQVTVVKANGERVPQTAYVRGDRVTRGPNGEPLPTSESIQATYGADDFVELRVLNLRRNGAQPTESAIYVTRRFSVDGRVGEFIVEDLPNGGDLDFDDGQYVQGLTGVGQAVVVREIPSLTVTTRTELVELDPVIDAISTEQEVLVEGEPETIVEDVEVARERGQVEIADENPSNLLGHATGVQTEAEEQLIYNRYSGASEARLGSDGVGVTGQLSPLIGNPSAPPTLLTGNLRFDPFANDNEAGLTATVGITQFLTRTHRLAEDVFGNKIFRLAEDGTPDDSERLLEPTGLFNNRRIVGYVPSVSEVVQETAISSANGIFNLPDDKSVLIAAPDPQRVGRGNAAYTDNVGGLLIENAAGELTFVPQWTKAGYAQTPITLAAGEANRIIYALVPQQAGQDLQLGQTYAVTEGAFEHLITDGGFRVISADRQPQNFVKETAEVYAVEDTVAEVNAETALFNGIQGIYAQVFGGEPVPTVDVTLAAEADARVGNDLFPLAAIEEAGQPGYLKTTRAGGLYLGGSLAGGLGNQEDTVFLSRTTVVRAIDELRLQRTTQTFSIPRARVDTITTESGSVSRNTGTAFFSINEAGELPPEDVRFEPGPETTTVTIDDRETRTMGDVQLQERVLIDSDTEETVLSQTTRELSREQESTTKKDSYPNFSAVLGEIALGGVYNFGNTPWTTAANTVRTELFFRDAVFGRSANGSETGIRAEVVFHPFGEVRRDAHLYDESGNVLPVYQTEPVLDDSGEPVIETLTGENGETVALVTNQFVLDEAGDRIPQQVGTGKAKGPGAYLRIENVFDDDDGLEFAGGIQLSF
ncbi:MAG: hypothetical protein WA885_00620 [Phormidesmis sp.]